MIQPLLPTIDELKVSTFICKTDHHFAPKMPVHITSEGQDATLMKSGTMTNQQGPIDAFTSEAKKGGNKKHRFTAHLPLYFSASSRLSPSHARPEALQTTACSALQITNTADVKHLGHSFLGQEVGLGDVQTILKIGNNIFDARDHGAARPYLQKAYDANGINTPGDLQALAHAWTKESFFLQADIILARATLQFPDNAALIAERGNVAVYQLILDKTNPARFEQQRQNALQFYAVALRLKPDSWQIKQNMEVAGVLKRAATYGSVVQYLPPFQRGEPMQILGAIVSGLEKHMTLKLNGSIRYPGGMLKIHDTCDRVDNVQLSETLLQIQRTWDFAAKR